MSMKGIRIFAELLSTAQQTKDQLIRLGAGATPVDTQDIVLGQLCEKMKEAVKVEFWKLTLDKK